MKLFNKNKKVISIPEGFTSDDIKIESSTCTGEKTIGFYDKFSKKLMYAELIRSDADISTFYEKYGIKKA